VAFRLVKAIVTGILVLAVEIKSDRKPAEIAAYSINIAIMKMAVIMVVGKVV